MCNTFFVYFTMGTFFVCFTMGSHNKSLIYNASIGIIQQHNFSNTGDDIVEDCSSNASASMSSASLFFHLIFVLVSCNFSDMLIYIDSSR